MHCASAIFRIIMSTLFTITVDKMHTLALANAAFCKGYWSEFSAIDQRPKKVVSFYKESGQK